MVLPVGIEPTLSVKICLIKTVPNHSAKGVLNIWKSDPESNWADWVCNPVPKPLGHRISAPLTAQLGAGFRDPQQAYLV